MQMLAETLRNGLAVSKRWHDMSHAAGTNQTACHSFLTFTETAQRRRSPLTGGCPCTRISLRLCLHIRFKNSARLSLHLYLLITMAPLSLRAFLGSFAPCFIFCLWHKTLVTVLFRYHYITKISLVRSGKCRATTALSFNVFFLFVFFFVRNLFPIQPQWLIAVLLTSKLMLCLPTTK